jgi:hypothetical protein
MPQLFTYFTFVLSQFCIGSDVVINFLLIILSQIVNLSLVSIRHYLFFLFAFGNGITKFFCSCLSQFSLSGFVVVTEILYLFIALGCKIVGDLLNFAFEALAFLI